MMREPPQLQPFIEGLVKRDDYYQVLTFLIVGCFSSDTNFDSESRQSNLNMLKSLDEAIGEVILGLPSEQEAKLAKCRKLTLDGIEILERELKNQSGGMKNNCSGQEETWTFTASSNQ